MWRDPGGHPMQIPVSAIWVFHAAARAGSISRAAEEFGVTPSAVTQQIQALEVQLGVTLLTKMGRRVVLTEAGERYFATITDEIERITDATSTIRGYRSVTIAHGARDADALQQMAAAAAQRIPRPEPGARNPPRRHQRAHRLQPRACRPEIRHGDGRWPGLFVEGMVEETFVPACAPALPPPAASAPRTSRASG